MGGALSVHFPHLKSQWPREEHFPKAAIHLERSFFIFVEIPRRLFIFRALYSLFSSPKRGLPSPNNMHLRKRRKERRRREGSLSLLDRIFRVQLSAVRSRARYNSATKHYCTQPQKAFYISPPPRFGSNHRQAKKQKKRRRHKHVRKANGCQR